MPRHRQVLKAGVLALCIFISSPAPAVANIETSKYHLAIVTADESETTKQIVNELQKQFPASQITPASNVRFAKQKYTVYIAVGPSALRALLVRGVDGVIVSIFTSSQTYREIVEDGATLRHPAVTAVYAEPSPFDQLRLISALYKKRVNVAVLIRDKNAYLLPILQQAASQANMGLSIEAVPDEHNLNRSLNGVATSTVLLALPDNTIYNPENIRNILITTYRRNQSVVGFSAAFVKAGALATTYSSIDDILIQVGELLNEFYATGQLPAAQFPKYFRVVVNESVARSLNLVIDDSVRLLSRKPGA